MGLIIKTYIAGPMAGLPDLNYPAFHDAANELRKLGFLVENPAENSYPEGTNWETYMKSAITRMLTCDAVVMLPDWNKSRGATLEHDIAQQLKIPMFNLNMVLHGSAVIANRLVANQA